MGDDIDAPHEQKFAFPDEMSVEGAIENIVTAGYLARAEGGATWPVVSGFPISVVAQRWNKPRPVGWQAVQKSNLQTNNGLLGLHFNYHAQLDPEIVLEVLKRLQLNAF